MIIWTGRGWIVFVFVFVCSLATEAIVEGHYQDESYYQDHAWPLTAALVAAALSTAVLARVLGVRPPDAPPEPSPGRDTLFFVPVRYWPPLLVVIGVVQWAIRSRG